MTIIFQLFDSTDLKGWSWIILIPTILLERFYPKLNWNLMIENSTIVFSAYKEKNIKFTEIDEVNICDDGLEIKLKEGIKKIPLNQKESQSIKSKIDRN